MSDVSSFNNKIKLFKWFRVSCTVKYLVSAIKELKKSRDGSQKLLINLPLCMQVALAPDAEGKLLVCQVKVLLDTLFM